MGRHGNELDKIGMADIAFVKAWAKSQEEQKLPPKKVVGQFGIGRGRDAIIMNWVINPRNDMRHGVIGPKDKFSRHSKESLKAMFKGW